MISNAQKAVLHVAKAQLKLSDDFYRAILKEQGGVDSSTKLTDKGFEAVMRRFEELGFQMVGHTRRARSRRRWSNPQPGNPVTPDQQQLIATLYGQLGWAELPRQMGFSKRCCGKSWPQTRTDANKVIEGLKAMLARSHAHQG